MPNYLIQCPSRTALLTIWSILAAVVVLCFIFITDDGFVAWMNFKSPPDVVYKVFILTIGVIGGLVCFLWEVKKQEWTNCKQTTDIWFSASIEIFYTSNFVPAHLASTTPHPSSTSSISKDRERGTRWSWCLSFSTIWRVWIVRDRLVILQLILSIRLSITIWHINHNDIYAHYKQ